MQLVRVPASGHSERSALGAGSAGSCRRALGRRHAACKQRFVRRSLCDTNRSSAAQRHNPCGPEHSIVRTFPSSCCGRACACCTPALGERPAMARLRSQGRSASARPPPAPAPAPTAASAATLLPLLRGLQHLQGHWQQQRLGAPAQHRAAQRQTLQPPTPSRCWLVSTTTAGRLSSRKTSCPEGGP